MKKARLSEDEPVVLETWAPEEYDRTHPEDYDPDVARSCWDMEKEEEQERQLLDRWALLELDGAECTMTSTSFWTISRAFPQHHAAPHARRGALYGVPVLVGC